MGRLRAPTSAPTYFDAYASMGMPPPRNLVTQPSIYLNELRCSTLLLVICRFDAQRPAWIHMKYTAIKVSRVCSDLVQECSLYLWHKREADPCVC
jgi:hypothetical protein